MAKLQGIQVARGVAALAVVLFHAKLILIRFPDDEYIKLPYFFSHGDIGVSFFFVISGFIISYVIDKDSFAFSSFFIKRFFRLLPTYFFCTILFVAIYLIHRNKAALDLGYSFDYLISSVLMLPMSERPALQPGWSLEHEVLFYIFASVLAVFFKLRGVLYGLLALVLVSILVRVVLPELYGFRLGWDYHILSPLNLCFLFGVGLYIFWKKSRACGDVIISKYWLIVGSALILGAPYLVEFFKTFTFGLSDQLAVNSLRNGFIRFSIESTASVILLYGMLRLDSQALLVRSLAAIGDRSYSLYLSHFILIPVFNYTHRELISWPQQFAEILCVLFVLIAILLGCLIHWCVEQPSSNYGVRLANSMALGKPK